MDTKWVVVNQGNSTAMTLPEKAAIVNTVLQLSSTAGTVTSLSVVAKAPSSGEIEFTGTPDAPSDSCTLQAAPTANTGFLVEITPVGAVSREQ